MFKPKVARGTNLVVTTDTRGSDYVLPMDLPDLAEELTAHIQRLLDAGEDIIVVRADRSQALRDELAETQARLAMQEAEIEKISEERDQLRDELEHKGTRLADVQRALNAVNEALGKINPESPKDSAGG
jgi:septal ring factor EnvC (AmiA/AmiB activator)